MTKLNFFTPLKFNDSNRSFKNSIIQKVDNYFYLGGKKAELIEGRSKNGLKKVILTESKLSKPVRFLKTLSYFTLALPIILLAVKAALRLNRKFKVIDPKLKIEKGIELQESTLKKIQELMPKILSKQQDSGLEWLANRNNLIFKLKDAPNLVFKLSNSNQTNDHRFAQMIKAKVVCTAHQLSHLLIPHAKKFDVTVDNVKHTFIAEEALDIDTHESAQEENYHRFSHQLNDTARQLAIFIAKTGFNDVTWRNIPLINEADDFTGQRRVALIDLEHMKSETNGFLGEKFPMGNQSEGLIASLPEEHLDTVIKEAKKHGVPISEQLFQSKKEERLKVLESDKKLSELYQAKGFVTGKEPLDVDLISLGLDLTESKKIEVPSLNAEGKLILDSEDEYKREEKEILLKKVAEDVIAEINRLIEKNPDEASIKGKRLFILNISNISMNNKDFLCDYCVIGMDSDAIDADQTKGWVYRILHALVEKEHLFEIKQDYGGSYLIQA